MKKHKREKAYVNSDSDDQDPIEYVNRPQHKDYISLRSRQLKSKVANEEQLLEYFTT